MKKLFTLFALLAMFMGARADLITDLNVTFNNQSQLGFCSDWWTDGSGTITADEDGIHLTNTVNTATTGGNNWDNQLWLNSDATLDVDQTYTVKIQFKVSEGEAKVNCRVGNWTGGIEKQVTVNTTEYAEYTIEGVATQTASGLLLQFADYLGTLSVKSYTITHEGKVERPANWKELIVNGDAEKSWEEIGLDPHMRAQDANAGKICFWTKEKGTYDENTTSDPTKVSGDAHPAEIVTEADGNHAFICRAKTADTDGDAAAWDNQIWIESPRSWKTGETFKLSFRYKASEPVKTDTQFHKEAPGDYLYWQAINSIEFTTEWKTFEKEVTVPSDGNGAWSIAFNLNPNVKTPVDFYIDDISWSEMVLDKGLFVASTNTETGLVDYDYDSAVEFVFNEEANAMAATVGTAGKTESWVNEVMISTVRGNDRQYKANTLKTKGAIKANFPTASPDDWAWVNYEEGANYKVKLPAQGVWSIYVDTDASIMAFVQVEGDAPKQPIDIKANPNKVVVEAAEREYQENEAPEGYEFKTNEEGNNIYGYAWDNQFCIKANRPLAAGESMVVSFKYKAANAAKVGTQSGNENLGGYSGGALGDIEFTTEEQEFTKTFDSTEGMQTITFNMAIIKEANTYEIYDIVWKLEDETESLISQTTTENFFVKTAAGGFNEFGKEDETGISSVAVAKSVPTITVNLAGQRVSKNYKGIVIENGVKVVKK